MFITHKGKVMKNKRNQKNIIWKILLKIEKFFMTGKGMLYDVHFWKNDMCNSTELIYQKMTN